METRAVVREPHVGDVPVELEPVARCARGIDVGYLPARRNIGGPGEDQPRAIRLDVCRQQGAAGVGPDPCH
jgi:hypothetical protein